MPRLILGSTSRYRAELLRRLMVDFLQRAPDTDETPLVAELPAPRATRLALAKARAAARGEQNALVIGSDQVAELDGVTLDKPGDAATARAQLAASSGRVVAFHTALCLIDTRDGAERTYTDLTRVHFRELDKDAIARYVDQEQPLDCAGSFKCEGLGISLFDKIDSSDPTALIGLPLIALSRLLRDAGVALP